MPLMKNGEWHQDLNQLKITDHITTALSPEANRYHFYYSYGCPFAHRVNLVIHYLGLNGVISSSSTAPEMRENGWTFNTDYPDPLFNAHFLWEIYRKGKHDYSGRVSVPLLWDKHQQCLAANDSAETALQLATEWQHLADNPAELVPFSLKTEILTMNDWLNQHLSMKIYQVGLAKSQSDYLRHLNELFADLAKLDQRLANCRYLFGEEITLSDFFLFPTLVRFEGVYADLYKTDLKPLSDFPHLYRYLQVLYQQPAIQATVDMDYIRQFYYRSQPQLNPSGQIPPYSSPQWLK